MNRKSIYGIIFVYYNVDAISYLRQKQIKIEVSE